MKKNDNMIEMGATLRKPSVSLPRLRLGHITSRYAVRSAHPNPYGLRIPTGR